jgi:hypothetical protein
MKRPQPIRSLAREVRTLTENISEETLDEVVAAVLRRVGKIDRSYDIPYIAGYSRDGSTVFIDRHMPRSFVYRGRRVLTDRFLVTHEIVEKALLDQLSLHYLHAHQIALRIEQAAVRAAGIPWRTTTASPKPMKRRSVTSASHGSRATLTLRPTVMRTMSPSCRRSSQRAKSSPCPQLARGASAG